MKYLPGIIFLLNIFTVSAQTKTQWALWSDGESCGQPDTILYKKDYRDKYSNYNYALIWLTTKNLYIVGFIGDKYERLRMKFISVKKDSSNSDVYYITGKSMVKNNVCNFTGKVTITNIKCYKYIEQKDSVIKEGILFGDYCFYEDSTKSGSGVFRGSFASCWYINKKHKLKYDDLTGVCDMFCNNQFAGVWVSYKSHAVKTANWGDWRIPFSGNLDVGTGEFFPDPKYKMNGWESFKEFGWDFDTDTEMKHAEENAEKWWKN